jgi:hypothetical protein
MVGAWAFFVPAFAVGLALVYWAVGDACKCNGRPIAQVMPKNGRSKTGSKRLARGRSALIFNDSVAARIVDIVGVTCSIHVPPTISFQNQINCLKHALGLA